MVLGHVVLPIRPLSDHAFDTITGLILDALRRPGPLDGVHLDLHGAMVTQSHDDGEGEILARVRDQIGPDVVLVASLDMHANVTRAMVDLSDALTIYRTYPHIDMSDTGARAYRMMRHIAQGSRPAKAWRQAGDLIPLHAQHTGADPARALYHRVVQFDGPKLQSVDLAVGFTAADIADVGPSIVAYADSQAQADTLADDMANALGAAETQFDYSLLTPEIAVARALSGTGSGPVVIADVQDNPGAGAASDTTGLLRELLTQNASGAYLGLLHDPELAALAHAHGSGIAFQAQIGGRGPGDTPLHARVRVHHLSDGACVYTGDMYGGSVATLGPSAALEVNESGVFIIVTSIRNQCLDLAHFRHFNLVPEDARILCVKSTAHFRADFEPIARDVLNVAAPGQFPCLLRRSDYTKLRPGVRLR